jgi:hypothetical protein
MKTYSLVALILAITTYSCEKTVPVTLHTQSAGPTQRATDTTTSTSPDSTLIPPYPQQTANANTAGTIAAGCPVLSIYGDSLFYLQPASGKDEILLPVNNQGAGKYYAWPAGMVIDHNTGAIDLTQSQSGLKYAIGFVPAGTTDTCLSTLVIGGASYLDSVYVLVNGSTKAVPYFDANPSLASNCDGSGNGSGCKFDVNGTAAGLRVSVNKSSGEIDLKKTLEGNGNTGGAFGLMPFDGQTVTVPIYYQLKHGSNNAMQVINVQLVYYDSKASMQAGLLSNLGLRLFNALNYMLISTSANPRPPILVITRNK